jgi:putative transcriptional regulator
MAEPQIEQKLKVRFKLKEALKKAGISGRQLSMITGIRRPTIVDMKHNHKKNDGNIRLDHLAMICQVLNCDISDIMELVPIDHEEEQWEGW